MKYADVYAERKLGEKHPELGTLAHEYFVEKTKKDIEQPEHQDQEGRTRKIVQDLQQIAPLRPGASILVLGCGPFPYINKALRHMGYNAVGVEPVASFVTDGCELMGDSSAVLQGSAEQIPLADASQDVVLFESVLEHVDSIPQSLNEIYRVLAPQGIAYITTTNKYRFSITGHNGEYRTPFFNWFPKLVKECYVHHHLHFNPKLSNYTTRPAVHWFTYAELCQWGRSVGFSTFYSIIDVKRLSDGVIQKSRFRRFILHKIQYNPWFRALALTQLGGTIYMVKR